MATGDILAAWLPGQNDYTSSPPQLSRDTNYGFFLIFTDSNDLGCIFHGVMPGHYASGGVTVEFVYCMAGANISASAVIGASFQCFADGDDVSGSVSWDENTATVSVPDAAEEVDKKTITFTDGTDMANIVVGDPFRLRIRRLGSNVSDDATGNLQLMAVLLKES